MYQIKFVEKTKIHILCAKTVHENRAVYDIMWKKYCSAVQAAGDNIRRHPRFACCINKATNTHPEYVMPVTFPLCSCYENAAVHCLSCFD